MVEDTNLDGVTWRKSSFSEPAGNSCVEIADLTGQHKAVRDSTNPASGALVFGPAAWNSFLAATRAGEFD